MGHVHGLEPISTSTARMLVLGTMPGKESLRARQYYAHPRNLFWRIMGEILRFDAGCDYAQRVDALLAADVAVWDVLKRCTRESSLDSDIDDASVVVNDFHAFFETHQSIGRVFFNGAKAHSIFEQHVAPTLHGRYTISYLRLPSTSPANAGIPIRAKLAAWKQILA